MRIPRVYQPSKLSPGISLPLTSDAANHLSRVLRLSIGDPLRVFNGEGGEFSAKIINITKAQVIIEIEKYFEINTESKLKIHLGQGVSRGEKMDYTIQKAVELGVTEITPLLTERCGVKLSEERASKRLQHWRTIISNACEQCGRDYLSSIAEPVLLCDWLSKEASSDLKLVLDPAATQKLTTLPIDRSTIQNVTLLIGPEGGLSTAEILLAKQHNFVALNLGPRILRTETAAVVALTALQCWFGDLL